MAKTKTAAKPTRAAKPAWPPTLGDRLRDLRTAAGLSQGALATKSGLLLGRVTHIEQGISTNPNWSTMLALAVALECSLDKFRVDA